MSNVELFENTDLEINLRAVKNDDGSISINLEDAARGLGFTTVAKSGNEVVRWSRVIDYLVELGVEPTPNRGDYIPESVFYLLAMKASSEAAKKFQVWVATEVLPTIRKHGAYMTDQVLEKTLQDPDFMIGLLTQLKDEREKRAQLEVKSKQQEQQIAEMKPKVDYVNTYI